MHEIHQEFLAEAAAYETVDASVRSRARHERWLAAVPCPVLRLEGGGSTVDQLAQIHHYLAAGQAPSTG